MDASEIHPRRINAKEVLTPQKGDEFIFPIADGTAKWSGRDQEFRETTLRQNQSVWSEDLSGELQGEPEGFQPTAMDVLQEKRIDDYWNVNGNRSLSDSWTGFRNILYWKRNLRRDTHGPGSDSQKFKRLPDLKM